MDQSWDPLAGKQRPVEPSRPHGPPVYGADRFLRKRGLASDRWMEAPAGFEPANEGFAVPCLTNLATVPVEGTERVARLSSAVKAMRGRVGRSVLRRLPRTRDDQSAREAPQHPAQLAPLVAQVRVLAALVGQGRVAVDELQLDHAEGDSPVAYVHRALRQPHGKLGAEIEHPVGVAGEFVVLRLLLLVQQSDLELRGHVAQRGPVPQELAEADQRVLRLTGHHEG